MINRHFIFTCLVCILILILYFVSLENNREYFDIVKLGLHLASLGKPETKNWVESKKAGFVNYNIFIYDLKFFGDNNEEIKYLNYYLNKNPINRNLSKDKKKLPFGKFKIKVLFNPNKLQNIMVNFIVNEKDVPFNYNSPLQISFKRNPNVARHILGTRLFVKDLYKNSNFEVDDTIGESQYSYKDTFELNNIQSQHYTLDHIFIYRPGIDYHKHGNYIIKGEEDNLRGNYYTRLKSTLKARFSEEYKKRDSLLERLNIQNNNIDIFKTYSIEIDREYYNPDDKYTKIKFKIKQELGDNIKEAIKHHNSIATDMFDYNNYPVKLLYSDRNSNNNTINFVNNNFTITDIGINKSFDYKNNYIGNGIKDNIIQDILVYPKEIKIVDDKNPVDWNIPYDLDNKTTHGHRKTTNKHSSKYFKTINIIRRGYNTMDIEVIISQALMLELNNASRNSYDGKGYDKDKIRFSWKDHSGNTVDVDTTININEYNDLIKIGILKFKNIKTDTQFNHIFIYKKSNYKMWNFIISYNNDPELKECLNILNISNSQITNIKNIINTEFKNIFFIEHFHETIKYYQKQKTYNNSYFNIKNIECKYNSLRDTGLEYYPFEIILTPNEQLKKAIKQHATKEKDLIMKYDMKKPDIIYLNKKGSLEQSVSITENEYKFNININKELIQKTPNYINSITISLDNFSGKHKNKKWVTFQIVNGRYNFINDEHTRKLFCSINQKICVEINKVKYPLNTIFEDNECYYHCKGYPGCLDTPSKICKYNI